MNQLTKIYIGPGQLPFDQTRCGVCLEDFVEQIFCCWRQKKSAYMAPCKHIYHIDCLREYIQIKKDEGISPVTCMSCSGPIIQIFSPKKERCWTWLKPTNILKNLAGLAGNSIVFAGKLVLVLLVINSVTNIFNHTTDAVRAWNRPNTWNWYRQCPLSRDIILQEYQERFYDCAQGSRVVGGNLQDIPLDQIADCYLPWGLIEDKGRCFSNGKQIPLHEVQISKEVCRDIENMLGQSYINCSVSENDSTSKNDWPHKKKLRYFNGEHG